MNNADEADLFMRLLGRSPTAEERLAHLDPIRLTDLPEFRNRFRDAASSDAEVIEAIRLWPLASRDFDLQIMLISSEGLSKCRPGIEALLPQLRPRTLLTVICGEDEGEAFAAEHAELIVIPRASVFQLRAQIPNMAREAGWIALLEDHATVHPGWVDAALAAIHAAPDDRLAFTAAVSNEHSISPWSWANFLFNFTYHWAPSAAATLSGSVTSIVFRRDLVGARPLPTHQFEMTVLGRQGPVLNTMLVDHNQPVGWWEATVHVFDNGVVTGSALRRHHIAPRGAVQDSLRWVNGGRLTEIAKVLEHHPRRAELPAGTLGRIRWIGLCHSAGLVWGALFGAGGAQHRLE